MQEAENRGAELVPQMAGERGFVARGREVKIRWRFAGDGESITGVLSMPDTRYGLVFELGRQRPLEDDRIYNLAALDIRLRLEYRNGGSAGRQAVYLHCCLPLTQHEYFNGEIGLWITDSPTTDAAPDADPGPDRDPAPIAPPGGSDT
ncbi:hypothetical protein ACEN9F_16400 [Duganella sp. CT11-25]|uniref:hypothetical protein n=1 Tax=unclassified Duganella TaxID=2636909 RepID=UPI0039AFB196